MKRNYELKHPLAMAIVIGALVAAGGCDKQTPSGETVGQKVDKAIDKTNVAAEKAGNKIEESAKSAKETIKDAAETMEKKAGQVGAVMDDVAITASIKADLLKDPNLSALAIDVNTVKGEVTLKGEVSDNAARERVGNIAAAVTGVAKVNNLLSVKG